MVFALSAQSRPRTAFLEPGKVWLGAVGVTLILKLIAVVVYTPATKPIFDLGFSFDPYVLSLYQGKGFESCAAFGCDHSTRMPGVPYFVYALSFLTLKLRVAAAIKVCLMSVAVYFAGRGFAEQLTARGRLHWTINLALAGFLLFSPDLIKHMTQLQYEEGYLIEILFIVTVSLLSLLSQPAERLDWRAGALPVVFVSLAYLFKSSQILVWAVVVISVCGVFLAAGRQKAAAGLLALALVAPLGWTAHNLATGHRLSAMSSYDGENMFRGWNAHTLDIFPACHLDTLFVKLRTCQGRPLELPNEIGRPAYPDEWAWNDAYKARAMDWIRANPEAAARTFAVKAATFFLWPRLVPYLLMDETSETPRKPVEEALCALWIAFGRLLELAAFVLSLRLIFKGEGRDRALGLSCAALLLAYAAPYVLGFSTERHFAPFLMIAALCDFFLVDRLFAARDKAARM